MLRIKSKELNKNKKTLIYLVLAFFILSNNLFSNEPVDIWKKSEGNEIKSQEKTLIETNPKNKIDFSKIKNSETNEIEIEDTNKELPEAIKLVGLYDPQENDLNLDMWSNTDGQVIKDTFKRINKIKLSKLSEEIFINTIMTYSYAPKNKLSEKEFLNLKLNWLIKNKKNTVIETFLNNNLEFDGKSKLIKHLVDHYISSGDIWHPFFTKSFSEIFSRSQEYPCSGP